MSESNVSMILIGQYDSPFVRRVAIAMDLYGFAFAHRPWSTFGDAAALAPFNPLRRVPALVLEDGAVLIDSFIILDWLDEIAGPGHALIAPRGVARRETLKTCALAAGLADKAVSLLYERLLHKEVSEVWTARCQTQIAGVLDALEAERTARRTDWWHGETIGHADIATACAIRFTREAHPGLFDPARWPVLEDHAARCEALDPFRRLVQPLIPPGGA